VFAVVIGRRVARSPSIYPDDPDSAHYDPDAYASLEEKVTPRDDYAVLGGADAPEAGQTAPSHTQPDRHVRAAGDDHEPRGGTNSPSDSPLLPGDNDE
jgi:hypothetical protein